jgi:hypothetical protein
MTAEHIAKLREKVALLEKRIAIVKERVEHARWAVRMLIRAKASNPNYPFWEWEHRQFFHPTVRTHLRRVTWALSSRLSGTWEFDESCKDIPGIVSEELYQPRPPTREEVFTFVKITAGFTSNAQVMEMFVMKRLNGYPDPLIDFVLAQ